MRSTDHRIPCSLDAIVSYFWVPIFRLCYALSLKIIELEVERRDVAHLVFETHWLSRWWCRASCPRMLVDILGTNCDQWQCLSMVKCCFTSTETVRLVRTENPGRPPRLSHSSWTSLFRCCTDSVSALLSSKVVFYGHCLCDFTHYNQWKIKMEFSLMPLNLPRLLSLYFLKLLLRSKCRPHRRPPGVTSQIAYIVFFSRLLFGKNLSSRRERDRGGYSVLLMVVCVFCNAQSSNEDIAMKS